MTTPSQKLAIALPTQVDPFSTADLRANWEKIDASPGSYICTSSTRPSWTAQMTGRKMIETNTKLEWIWDGTKFVRLAPFGLLKKGDGNFAIGERTTNFDSTMNSFNKVVSVTGVVVPDGRRPLRVDVGWLKAYNAQGNFKGAIFRSNSDNTGPNMGTMHFGTTGNDDNAGGGTFWAIERAGLAAGSYDFSFQVTAPDGHSKIDAGPQTPCTIMVTEL